MKISTERQRLANEGAGTENWRRWGPYLAERQWGTVREDYSASGAAWDHLPHDHARSRAYRWGSCRDIWSWEAGVPKPKLIGQPGTVEIQHSDLGRFRVDFDSAPTLLFCDNDTNARRLYGTKETSGYFKDGFHEYLVEGRQDSVNPQQTGTKAGALHDLKVESGAAARVRLRLSPDGRVKTTLEPFADFDAILEARGSEADEFYAELQPRISDPVGWAQSAVSKRNSGTS
jgi:hypothetical protein